MPAATRYPNPTMANSAEARKLDESFDQELMARARRIDANTKRYNNEVDPPIKDPELASSNVTLPLCRLVIDKGVAVMTGTDDYGNIEGVDFEVTESTDRQQRNLLQRTFERVSNAVTGGQSEEDARQDFLERFWKANRKNKILHNFFLQNALAGHYFWQIEPDALPDPDGGPGMLPRLIALDARNVGVFWDAMDAEKVLWYRVQVGERGSRRRKDVVRVYDENGVEAGRWIIYNYKEMGDSRENRWELDGQPIEWGHRWSPIMDGQNLPSPVSMSYYGQDDLRGGLDKVNDGLNFSSSLMMLIQNHHGFPKLVVTGGQLKPGYQNSPDEALTFEDAEAKVYYVEPTSDGGRAMDQMQFMERQFWNSAREVDPASVAGKLGQMSNFDLRIIYQDALFKRQSKWLDAGETLAEVCQAALELGGFGANIRVTVTPPPPLPTNLAETVSAFDILSNHGLSDDTILTRTGHDPEDERAKRKIQDREQSARQTRGRQAQEADESRQFGRSARIPSSNPMVEAQQR